MTSKRFESIPLKVLFLSKMYRHDFSYMCASPVNGNVLFEAVSPERGTKVYSFILWIKRM